MTPREFCNLVRDSFAFLEREFFVALEGGNWGAPASPVSDSSEHAIGRLGPDGGYSVRFDSPRVFVRVVYDATRSWELSLELGLQAGVCSDFEQPFELSEMLRVAGLAEVARQVQCIQTPSSDLHTHLERLATLLRDHGGEFLAGDLARFAALNAQQRTDCEAYELETSLRYAREDARKAWDAGKFDEVVRQMEPFLANLFPSERKRLEIARKRCGAL